MKPALFDKMEKGNESTLKIQTVQETQSLRCLASVGMGLIVCLLTALVVFSILIYGNTKDINKIGTTAKDIPKDVKAEVLFEVNPKLAGFHQLQNKKNDAIQQDALNEDVVREKAVTDEPKQTPGGNHVVVKRGYGVTLPDGRITVLRK